MISTNATFMAWAQEMWNSNRTGQTPSTFRVLYLRIKADEDTGPYSNVGPSLLAHLPLTAIAPDMYEQFALDLEDLDPSSVLPPDTHPSVVAGYSAQLKLLAKGIRSPDTAWLQWGQTGGGAGALWGLYNMKPLSRGSVNINISDPNGPPLVDYRVLTNPLDNRINVAFIRLARAYFSRNSTIQQLSPVEVSPGANVTSEADLEAYVRSNLNPSELHPVGTCAKMALELGGVVDEELKVYGIKGLRVVDASVMPLIVGANTQASVYALAEMVCCLFATTTCEIIANGGRLRISSSCQVEELSSLRSPLTAEF